MDKKVLLSRINEELGEIAQAAISHQGANAKMLTPTDYDVMARDIKARTDTIKHLAYRLGHVETRPAPVNVGFKGGELWP